MLYNIDIIPTSTLADVATSVENTIPHPKQIEDGKLQHSLTMKSLPKLVGAASALALVAAGSAWSQDNASSKQQPPKAEDWIDITPWNSAALYEGWRANNLLQEEAYGSDGGIVGEIEDLIVNSEGQIVAVVVEGGGTLDIGDTHARISWDKVTRQGADSVTVQYSESAFEDGDLLGVDDMPAGEGNYRVRELIGDTVRDGEGVGYGFIRDVIFSQDDEAQAVIVRPDRTYGYTGTHAVPYSARGYDPYVPDYWVPYAVEDLSQIERLDYRRMDSREGE